MPDLNELLRWSIQNTPSAQDPAPAQTETDGTEPDTNTSGELSLRFNPNTTPSAGSSALHPSDPQYRAPNSASVTTPDNVVPARRDDLTTEMLDLIMGKSDSVVMKEKMAIAMDESNTLDERVEALDDFEMLIELIDNANNMAILKLWDPLVELLQSKDQPIVAHACWIIGTAVQNNLKAQAALFIFDVLPKILSIIYGPQRGYTATRAKATYALSSALKHWPLAGQALSKNDSQGYQTLYQGVVDTEGVIRRKMSFLVGTLVMQSGEKYTGEIPSEVRNLLEDAAAAQNNDTVDLVDGLKGHGVFSGLVQGLKEFKDDIEFEENAVRAISRAAQKGGLSEEKRSQVRNIWAAWGADGQEERGLGGEDGQEVTRSLA